MTDDEGDRARGRASRALLRRLRRLAAGPAALFLSACVVPVPLPAPQPAAPAQTFLSTQGAGTPILASTGPARGCALPARGQGQVAEVVARVNAQRQAAGLPPLRASRTLARVAQAHACDNAARGVYSHVGSDGSDLGTRLQRGGYALRVAAENTGLGFDEADRAVAFWMQSPKHRANILNARVTEIGVGLAQGARPSWVMVMAAGL